MLRNFRNALVAASLLFGGVGSAGAGTMLLEWDAAANAQGYRLYYGTASGQYTQTKDVGNALSASLSGLADCTTWYVAVKAYNSAGESPSFSNEVVGMPRPAITNAGPPSMQGSQLTLNVNGANFQNGATVEVSNPHIVLQNARVVSCNQMQVSATIEPMASGVRASPIGRFEVTVTNPDRVYGQTSNAFEVLLNPRRFDVNVRDEGTRGRVDGKDIVDLARSLSARDADGTRPPDSHWNPDSDLNGDGQVDGEDLAYLASSLVFSRCWNGTTWTANACQ